VPTVERAKLQAANAEAKLRRAEQLYKQKPPLISEQDYQDIRTTFQVAQSDYDVALLTSKSLVAEAHSRKAELDQAVQRLDDATVRAPQKGDDKLRSATRPTQRGYAVAERIVSVGEYVQEGAALFRLVASDPIKYRARVPERFMSEVKVGQPAEVAVEAYANRPFTGRIARVSPQIDPDTRTFLVEVLIANGDGLLLPGAFARGQLMTHVDDAVVFVPEAAVVSFAGVNKVFTVKDGKAVELRIEPGMKRGGYVEVRTGLTPDVKQVVVTGVNKLATGTPVNVQQAVEAKSE
jgi:membrane fusion protein (multidrug efflux system)